MTVSFHEPSDENLAPGGENIEKRKFPVRSTPHPSKKLRSIDEASTASPPNCAQGEESRTLFFGGQETVTTPDNIAGDDEEAMGKDKVRQKNDRFHPRKNESTRLDSTHHAFLVPCII
jgi:hypothetical protein